MWISHYPRYSRVLSLSEITVRHIPDVFNNLSIITRLPISQQKTAAFLSIGNGWLPTWLQQAGLTDTESHNGFLQWKYLSTTVMHKLMLERILESSNQCLGAHCISIQEKYGPLRTTRITSIKGSDKAAFLAAQSFSWSTRWRSMYYCTSILYMNKKVSISI